MPPSRQHSIPLILDTGPAIVYEAATGILEASSGSTLEIESNVTNNGQVLVKDSGTVEFINDTITGGQINVSSSGAPPAGDLRECDTQPAAR